jgi:glutamate decarboxylase
MALHSGRPLHEPSVARGGNPFATVANPALAQQVAPPLHALAEDPVPADTAWQLVHDELMLDGRSRLNLATFVTTWMEPQADRLMAECADKNMIDKDEYPQTAEFERRCVSILADLWHAPDPADVIGCSTTGSSEAAMLAGMALKRRWAARQPAGSTAKPNLVMGINVRAQLLPAGCRGGGPVLHVLPARPGRLPGRPAGVAGHRRTPGRRDRGDGGLPPDQPG